MGDRLPCCVVDEVPHSHPQTDTSLTSEPACRKLLDLRLWPVYEGWPALTPWMQVVGSIGFRSAKRTRQSSSAIVNPSDKGLTIAFKTKLDAKVKTSCKQEELKHKLYALGKEGSTTDSYAFNSLLRLCTDGRLLGDGRRVHELIVRSGLLPNLYLGTALVNMYAKCGNIEDAHCMFANMPDRNVFTWNTIILAYINVGQTKKAINLFRNMKVEEVMPDEVTFVTIFRACTSLKNLEQGALVHAQLIIDGVKLTISIWNALLDMYMKCRRIEDAVQVFKGMNTRDMVSWTIMVTGHINHGNALAALDFFSRSLMDGLEPDEVTFVTVLHACAILGNAELGKQVHAYILETVIEMNVFTGDTLVDMYTKCGSIQDARKVFDNLPARNVVSWNALLGGYVNKNEHPKEVFTLFGQMQCEPVRANEITIVSILHACVVVEDLKGGMTVHDHAVQTGFESLVIVGNALANMYANCGSIVDAYKVFERMPEHDVVSWNSMISGLAKHGYTLEALNLFQRMGLTGIKPDVVTFVGTLNVIASTQNLDQGRILHGNFIETGLQCNTFMENTLVDMYSKCGSTHDAWQVFNNMSNRDAVSWNAILLLLSVDELHGEVIKFFWKMQNEGMKPDGITYVRALNGCASIGFLKMGNLIHAHVIEGGFEADMFVGSSLIDMYAKAGSIECARQVFDKLPERDIVSWTSLIAAYTNNGQGKHALKLFCQLELEGVRQDEFTFMNALNACASLAALEKGKMVHALIVDHGFEDSILVGNALVDMYSKSGSTTDARRVLDTMPARNVVSWNAMIAGYAQHGHGKEALQLVNKMQHEGTNLNHITFLGVLCACSHAGLAVEGCNYFNSMNRVHGIEPMVDHYACMIDLFGRTGHLEEALNFIKKMPFQPSAHMWKALLRACQIHRNLSVGKVAAEKVLKSEPESAGTYVMLSNIYAAFGMWSDHAQVIKTMKERGVQKQVGCSCIEIDTRVYGFVASDTSHPQIKDIHAKLDVLFENMKAEGYDPDTSFVRHDVEEEHKELILRHHSEKLAIAFGLINTPSGTPLCIIKNLRVCGDCHTASKFISKIVRREIILRDTVRFHHIRDGVCTCGDYW